MIRILLADDDGIIREGLNMIINMQQDMELVGVAANGEDAVKIAREQKPEVALLDIRMPGMDGIEASRIMLEEKIATPLLLTTFDEQELILKALKTGVAGYILKNSPAERLLSAIRVVAVGGTVFQRDIMEYITTLVKGSAPDKKKSIFSELTAREHEVASLVAKGMSNKEISEKLFISDGTVRNHISIILDKSGLEHRTQIAIEYIMMENNNK